MDEGPFVFRRLVAKLLDRQVSHHIAAMAHDEALGRRGLAHHREIEPPFAEDRLGFFFLFGLEHHEHALLAFRQHHLVGAHALFTARHLVEIERDAEIALGAHFHGGARQARRAHILNGDDAALLHDLKAGLEQQLFRKRIADLHGRALAFGVLIELCRSHRGAMDAIAPGLRAEIDDRHADAGSGGVKDLVLARDPDRHGIDEAISVVA